MALVLLLGNFTVSSPLIFQELLLTFYESQTLLDDPIPTSRTLSWLMVVAALSKGSTFHASRRQEHENNLHHCCSAPSFLNKHHNMLQGNSKNKDMSQWLQVSQTVIFRTPKTTSEKVKFIVSLQNRLKRGGNKVHKCSA